MTAYSKDFFLAARDQIFDAIDVTTRAHLGIPLDVEAAAPIAETIDALTDVMATIIADAMPFARGDVDTTIDHVIDRLRARVSGHLREGAAS